MTAPAGLGRELLIVDDDDDLRALVAEVLRAEGWRVFEARDGAEGLRLALELKPSVIVLDHRMPRLTGAEVYQQLRAQDVGATIILVTAARDVPSLAASLGIACFLGKPFDADALIELVRRAHDGDCR
ncbi:response regulator [Myxococcota bacterium]|nr:response regulator [Myxococcota bacterium]